MLDGLDPFNKKWNQSETFVTGLERFAVAFKDSGDDVSFNQDEFARIREQPRKLGA